MASNYPPGVTDADFIFPTCPNCYAEISIEGEDCPECGEYVPTPEDYEDEAADRAYDAMREGGL